MNAYVDRISEVEPDVNNPPATVLTSPPTVFGSRLHCTLQSPYHPMLRSQISVWAKDKGKTVSLQY